MTCRLFVVTISVLFELWHEEFNLVLITCAPEKLCPYDALISSFWATCPCQLARADTLGCSICIKFSMKSAKASVSKR